MNCITPTYRPRYWLAAAAAALWLAACGGGDSSGVSSSAVSSQGTVVDDQGIPLSGATIKVIAASAGVASASTENDGSFSVLLSKSSAGVIRVEKAGFMPMIRAAGDAANNANFAARVVLLPVASTQTFDSTQAAVLRVPGSSARVELAASSLVRTDGQAISGSTTVQLTPIDPSKDIRQMPGVMVDAASGTPIESLGALSVTFTDASGAALNLASGQTATIRIPATPAAGATLPATFPLYHLNETTGLWEQEGTATLQTDPATGDKYYEGTVSHFSWWNADKAMERSTVDFGKSLDGATCTTPAGATVISQGVDYNGVVGSDARSGNIVVRQNSQVRIVLLDRDGFIMDSVQVASAAAGSTVRLPRCLRELPIVTLSGRVSVTSGALDSYRVQISGNFLKTVTTPINTDGSYAISVRANRGAVQARLVAYSNLGTPDTLVATTVETTHASFPDLVVQDTRFNLSGCVQGWSTYRQTRAQVSVFRDATQIGQPQTVQSSSSNFTFTDLPLNSTLTFRVTAPDATLAEKTTSLVVGNTPAALGGCLDLPQAATAQLLVSGTGLSRNFDASGSVAGDAAITSYAWNFGDGSTGTGATASHSFASAGSYQVSLRVTDALKQVTEVRRSVVASADQTLSTLTATTALDAGNGHTCAVRADSVWCWGSNTSQQLGSPHTFTPCDTCGGEGQPGFIVSGLMSSGVPLQVGGLSNVTAVSAGENHSCALHANGTVSCWGNGKYGQLGNGSRLSSGVPVAVSNVTTAVAIAAGTFKTCALLQGGSVSCWGTNSFSGGNLAPTQVAGLSGVSALSAGRAHYCAVLADATVRCWGSNDDGQLGNGNQTDSDTPVIVSGISTAVAVVAGTRHSCALLADGTARCWGYRGISSFFGSVRSGLMGDGGTGFTPALSPVQVTGISTAKALVTGLGHVCALLQDDSVKCWGSRGQARGQADTNDLALSPVPINVTGAVKALALGDSHTCLSLADGSVQCLGSGHAGLLGTGGQSLEQNPSASPYPAFSITPLSVQGLP
ncbi:PKD domain containing protein [Comamonadaceae bacterium]